MAAEKEKTAAFPRDAKGSNNRATCTNFLSLVGFLAYLAGMVFIVGWASIKGGADTHRLTHHMDYNGSICGVDEAVKNKSYIFYCPKPQFGRVDNTQYPVKLDYASRSCVYECPTSDQTRIPCLARALVTPGTEATAKEITFDISQTVSLAPAYPTTLWRGKMCIPGTDAPNNLRDELITHANSPAKQLGQAIGSLRHSWPILLGVAVLAMVFSLLYLLAMKRYAGPLIMLSLVMCCLLSAAASAFFMIGLFFNPYDEASDYAKANPIFRSTYGESARASTFFLGLFLAGLTYLLVKTTRHSVSKIDEAVGIIFAATECIFDDNAWFTIQLVPLFSAIFEILLLAVLGYGAMLVLSVGTINGKTVVVNGHYFTGLYKEVQREWYWDWALFYYGLGVLWIFEISIAAGQYVITYMVCTWFFVETKKVANTAKGSQPFQAAYKGQGKKVSGVRVHGVDSVMGGERGGYIEQDVTRGSGHVLVVPLGIRHPDGKDYLAGVAQIEKKTHPIAACTEALVTVTFHHLGSLCLAAPQVFITRPFRASSNIIKFLMTPSADKFTRANEEDLQTLPGLFNAAGGLITGFISHWMGGISRDAYVDIVLQGSDWATASSDVAEFIGKIGGVVAFLHGSTSIYEMIAVFFIVTLTSGIGLICMTQITAFSDTASPMYVQNPFASSCFSIVISLMISFMYMSLFNNTADTLLYTFAWARKRAAQEEDFPELYNPKTGCCPEALLALLSKEADEPPQQAFTANTGSQLTRFNHAHKKFAGATYAFATGKGDQLPASWGGTAEQKPLLSKTNSGPQASTRFYQK
eukprot:CAMPEP_0115126214 /NCGR_PEP_ID=MMETSP0227-20121206/49573_1 /TAXON_ID=89957 /ORGANISM="Polarella glacialis, Strain CCMP 1383" /LENGTH=809 /DNA_ID=CAMNT_0002529871 /DNA_START=72 /DNA_END=2501 /DNA_ORIENTATION=-